VTRWRYVLALVLTTPLVSYADEPANELKFEIHTLPGYQKYVGLLEYPGYIGVALENNDLHPTLSSKMTVRQRGRELAAENLFIRFTGRTDSSYAYEAGLSLGIGKTSVTFPVTVDLSGLNSGKTMVVAKLPLATLIPNEMRERIQTKVRTLANLAAQQKVLDYLDERTKTAGSADATALMEAILLDAYNRSDATPAGDVGDAVPLSEQWMLLLTLAIWLIVVPVGLITYRLRRRRAKPVVP
jgi:hypothetical protein